MAGQPARVFVDANVLYSKTLRDWLGLLYTDQDEVAPFQVFWSEDVLAEVVYHLRKNHPEWDGGKLSNLRDRIAQTFEVGRVTDYSVDGSYQGNDPHDAHVHAAAVACQADYLLTCDHADFASEDPDELPYEIVVPDEFFVLVDRSSPELVDSCISHQIAYHQRRRGDVDLDGALKRAGCPDFAEVVVGHLRERALRGH